MKQLKPKIKVCGMRDTGNIRQLVKLKPDYMGFILYPKSKRYLGDDYKITAAIPKKIKRVGVFVNALLADVVSWHNRLQLDYVQIHGNESPEYCQELFELEFEVIKAFGVNEDFDFSILEAYMPWCSYFLFDTKTPEHGGSGKQFDWNLLQGYTLDKPIILSGGIGPDDAIEIKTITGLPLHAIDINSRFEDAPAQKNIEQLRDFFSIIRK